MINAYDVYAEFNPGFCASVLQNFIEAYMAIQPTGPELPVLYLALPIVLSGELQVSFQGTNRNTGLLEWLNRNPYIYIDLAARINSSTNIASEAIRFACFSKILNVGKDARCTLGDKTIKKKLFKNLSQESEQTLKRAQKLGYWFADAGTTKTIFNILGISL